MPGLYAIYHYYHHHIGIHVHYTSIYHYDYHTNTRLFPYNYQTARLLPLPYQCQIPTFLPHYHHIFTLIPDQSHMIPPVTWQCPSLSDRSAGSRHRSPQPRGPGGKCRSIATQHIPGALCIRAIVVYYFIHGAYGYQYVYVYTYIDVHMCIYIISLS